MQFFATVASLRSTQPQLGTRGGLDCKVIYHVPLLNKEKYQPDTVFPNTVT
uniref:Uncharacterized protein n=1 Tax=Arion vulgaris TaxID=1028688 RepID=A0A0B7AUJ1_9EUPU